jgi:hypothetical protein
MEAAGSFETSVPIYQTIRLHNSEDRNLSLIFTAVTFTNSFEMLVLFYQATRRHVSDNRNLSIKFPAVTIGYLI